MSTHAAVVTAGIRAPLEIRQIPTVAPMNDEVLVRVEWTASTPLDLHQNDGGLLVKHPQVLGDGIAGTVVEVTSNTRNLKIGDQVQKNPAILATRRPSGSDIIGVWIRMARAEGEGSSGVCHRSRVSSWIGRSHIETSSQDISHFHRNLQIPEGFTLQQAVTVPSNFVTVFHAVTEDLGLALPWPRPNDYQPPQVNDMILIWGGSSSVGQYAIQILSYYGYRNLIATASSSHHQLLQSFGASRVFDYKNSDVTAQIIEFAEALNRSQPTIPFVFDCIGSKSATLAQIAKIARKGTKVAVLLPVIVRDASETVAPEYSMDAQASADWADGVIVSGVRTHFYLNVSIV